MSPWNEPIKWLAQSFIGDKILLSLDLIGKFHLFSFWFEVDGVTRSLKTKNTPDRAAKGRKHPRVLLILHY